MSGPIENILNKYEEDINHHDCQQWEKQLSRDHSFVVVKDEVIQRKTRRKMELLDVDLVRGSTFPKSKTRHDFKSILLFSLMSVIFFPFRSSWWIRKTSHHCYFLGCSVFISSLLNLYWYHFYLCQDELESCEKVTIHEVYEPILLFVVLAFLQCQIVSPLKYKNLDFFDQEPLSQCLNEINSCKRTSLSGRRKSSVKDHKSSAPSSRSASEARKTVVRKLSHRHSVHSYNHLDSWHENSSSGSENDHSHDEHENIDNVVDHQHGSDSQQRLYTQSSEEPDSDNEEDTKLLESSKQPRRRLSKPKMKEKDSDRLSSSTEDKQAQSSPIELKIGTTQWNDNEAPSKVYMSALQIGNKIFDRSQDNPDTLGYAIIGIFCSVFIALLPLTFKIEDILYSLHKLSSSDLRYSLKTFLYYSNQNATTCNEYDADTEVLIYTTILLSSAINRIILTVAFFVLLSVAERAFKRRFLTAKLFSHITSTRKSMKSQIPHFRLYKVRNIKAWLCVRAYLRKRGPQRSIDCIVSTAFILTLANVSWLCYQLLQDEDIHPEISVTNCEVISWCVSIGLFLVRYMTLASQINKKYRNLSVLLTEQINLYLQMEMKPQKKEQLQLANNVLKLSSDLLKELETPFKINGLSANPFLYNCTKVLVLSAVSGVLSEMLGFKLKLYKVKVGV